MPHFNEPAFDDTTGKDDNSDGKQTPVVEKIGTLAGEQLFGILCTQTDGQPYGSMIGFAFSDDLRHAVFATPKATRKYRNLRNCHNVALVVNNRDRHPTELMKIEAFTATGIAEELEDCDTDSPWARLLIDKQHYLKSFLDSSTTALFRIKIVRFFFVSSFQEVREWRPQ